VVVVDSGAGEGAGAGGAVVVDAPDGAVESDVVAGERQGAAGTRRHHQQKREFAEESSHRQHGRLAIGATRGFPKPIMLSVQRIAIVGSPGAGKTTLAEKLADRLDLRHIEMDSIFHQPGWRPLPDAEFIAAIERATSADRWVTCGNYQRVSKPIIWQRADTVVFLDLPKATVMRSIIHRSVRRAWKQEELWNGNRERFRNFFSLHKEENIILWAWTQFDRYRKGYRRDMQDPQWSRLDFVHLESRTGVTDWLEKVAAG
jgi:adenylate kinase family enzyme